MAAISIAVSLRHAKTLLVLVEEKIDRLVQFNTPASLHTAKSLNILRKELKLRIENHVSKQAPLISSEFTTVGEVMETMFKAELENK